MTPHPQGNGKPGDVAESEREKAVVRAAQKWGDTDAADVVEMLAAELELSNALVALGAVTVEPVFHLRSYGDVSSAELGGVQHSGKRSAEVNCKLDMDQGARAAALVEEMTQGDLDKYASELIWLRDAFAAPVPEAGQGVSDEQIDAAAEQWCDKIAPEMRGNGLPIVRVVFSQDRLRLFVRALLSPAPAQAQAPAAPPANWRELLGELPVSTPPQSAQLIEPKPETGELDPRVALAYAKRMKEYCEAFSGRDWAAVMLHGSPDEQNLAHALDNLTECAAMLMNTAGRLEAGSGLMEGKDAVRDVLAERQRQVTAEGYFPAHDDEHDKGELAVAAACYALRGNDPTLWITAGQRPCFGSRFLQRVESWVKSKNRRSNLVRAAALLLAEIERLDRAALSQGQQTEQGSRNG